MSFIKIKNQDEVLYWTIDRTDRRNSLGTTLESELSILTIQLLAQCLKELNSSAPCLTHRMLVISAVPIEGKNKPTWIAGGDLKELAQLDSAHSYASNMTTLLDNLEKLPIPVVMRISGAAIGGGAEFALAGDFRFATKDSCMSFKQLQVGLAIGYGSTKRIVNYLGLQNAKECLLLSKTLHAKECRESGIFNGVFESAEELHRHITVVAQKIRATEPQSIAAQKEMFRIYAQRSAKEESTELEIFKSLWRNPTHEGFLNDYK